MYVCVQEVSTTVNRYYSASSIIRDTWWITGGDGSTTTSEIYTEQTDQFEQSITLPRGLNSHCQVTINNDQVFLASESDAAYIWDFNIGDFTQLRNLDTSRNDAVCGLIRTAFGVEIVVASDGTSR